MQTVRLRSERLVSCHSFHVANYGTQRCVFGFYHACSVLPAGESSGEARGALPVDGRQGILQIKVGTVYL